MTDFLKYLDSTETTGNDFSVTKPIENQPIDFSKYIEKKGPDPTIFKTVVNSTTPDREAEISDLSKRTGLAEEIVRSNFDSAKIKAEHGRISDLVKDTPALSRFIGNPKELAAVHDDIDMLAQVEIESSRQMIDMMGRGVQAALKTAPRAANILKRSGFNVMAFGSAYLDKFADAVSKVTGFDKGGLFEAIQNEALGMSRLTEKTLNESIIAPTEAIKGKRLFDNPELIADPEWLIQNIGDAGASMIPVVLSAVAGGPVAAGMTGGSMEGAGLFDEMMREGKTDRDTALKASTAYGIVSSYLNKLGIDKWMDTTAAKTLKDRLFKSFAAGGTEGLTEWLEEPAQAFIKTLAEGGAGQEILSAVTEAAKNIDVIPGAFVMGGGMSYMNQGQDIRSQAMAEEFRNLHERIGAASDQSKTKERSPDHFEKFLDTVGFGETGFITPEGAEVLFQSNPEAAQVIIEKLGLDPQETMDHVKNGLDIPVKMSAIHARLLPEERAAILDDLKPAPSAMSKRQADNIDIEGNLAAMADRFSDAMAEESAFKTELDRVKTEAIAAGALPEQVQEFGKLIEKFSDRMALEGQSRVDTLGKIRIQGRGLSEFEQGSGSLFQGGVNGNLFRTGLNDYLSGNINPRKAIEFGTTPIVLQAVGAGPLPLKINQETLKKVLFDKHKLSKELISRLPEKIADPIMIFKSATVENGLVVMTELEHDGKTVVAAVHLNIKKGGNFINRISSVHPREENSHFINWIEKGLLRYKNNEKTKGWFHSRGLQLPEGGNSLSDKKILSEKDIVNKNILFQDKRGAVTITDQGYLISLFKGAADPSTLVHETGHIFLEEMQSLISLGNASESLIKDHQTAMKWLEATDGQPLTTEQKEKFARGFEAFLMEGKSPSAELEPTFERFRKWLLSVYKSALNLNVELTEEIRQVFGRMLNAETAINMAAAENQMEMPSKKIMDALGINQDDREYMKRLLKNAIGNAEKQIVKDRNADNQMHRKAWEAEAKKQLQELPGYQLLDGLSKGGGLNTREMVYLYGKENVSRIPRTNPPVVKKEGVSPTIAAAKFGYDSVDEMMEVLTGIIPKKDFVKAYVESKQAENDARFNPADYLIGTDEHSDYLFIMAKYQSRANGSQVDVPPTKAFKAYARKTFNKYKIKDATRIDRFLSALKKYSGIERKSAMTGDFGAASQANEKVRLNHELSGLSIKQRKAVEGLIKRAGKIIGSKGIKNEYKQQTLRVIQRFGLSKREIALDQDRVSIGEFFADLRSHVDVEAWQMIPTYSDFLTTDSLEMDYRELTVEQFEELNDLVKYLQKRGYKAKKDYLSDGKTETETIANELAVPIISRKRQKKKYEEDSILAKLTSKTRKFFATHDSLIFITKRLDGFVSNLKGGPGPNEININHRIMDADNAFVSLTAEISKKLDPITKYFQKRAKEFPKKILDTGVKVPEVMNRETEKSWTFDRILAVALNRGNKTNLQRLTGGYGLSEADIEKLTSILTDEDWDKIQEIWDIVDSLWPQMDAVFYRINDFHQKKVQPDAFKTTSGKEMRGGYYPIMYDRSLSMKAGEWKEKEDLMNSYEAMFQPANPKQGMLQSRVAGNVRMPVRLDLTVLYSHLNTSIRYITHAEAVNDINKIFKNSTYQAAVEKAEGVAVYEMLRPALAEIARPNALKLDQIDSMALDQASKATAYILGYNRSVALKQLAGFFPAINDLGDGNPIKGTYWLIRGLAKVSASPIDAYEAMKQVSPYMKNRSDNKDRDIRRNVDMIRARTRNFKGITWQDVQDTAFVFIKAMDFAVVFPVWHGAYQRGMKIHAGDMTAAIRYADSKVRDSQDSAQEIDLSHLQRSRKGWHRVLTMFSTFTLKYGQRQRYFYNAYRNGTIGRSKLLSIIAVEMIAPPVMIGLMFSLLWGEDPDEKELFYDVIASQFMGMLGFREIAGLVQGNLSGFYRDTLSSPVATGANLAIRFLTNLIKSLEDIDNDKKMEKALLALIEVLCFHFKAPVTKIHREVTQGIDQYERGEGTLFNIISRNPEKIRRD
jgi:hypothetical protein